MIRAMNSDQNPSFRRLIVPWYDSEPACLIIIFLMDLVFLFAAFGVEEARRTPEFGGYMGLPVLLMVLSGGVIVSITIRLVRRFIHVMRQRSR
jgi:hypothetical protein